VDLQKFRRLMSRMKCTVCGEYFLPRHIQVLGHQDDLWFLSVFCASCHSQGLVAALVRRADEEAVATEVPPGEPVTADDLLDMHNFLKTFDGDFQGLFAREGKEQ